MKKLELTQNLVAIVDDDIFDNVNQYKWFAQLTPAGPYACRWSKGTYPNRYVIRLHHIVVGITAIWLKEKRLLIDHIDRNTLNCQRSNLRITNKSINAINCYRSDK